MSTVADEDEDMRHLKSRAYYGPKIESYPGISLRHQRSCADFGPIMFDNNNPDCIKMSGETAYHRTTHMGAHFEGSGIEESSKPSWVAVQGMSCMCLVTWSKDKDGENTKEPDFANIFDGIGESPQVAVSLQLGIKEIKVGNGRAASFVERNKIVVTSFLGKLLKKKKSFSNEETLKLAVCLFDQLFDGYVKAENIKVFVWNKGENIKTVEDETLLEVSRTFYRDHDVP